MPTILVQKEKKLSGRLEKPQEIEKPSQKGQNDRRNKTEL